jgi:hypothetical protein
VSNIPEPPASLDLSPVPNMRVDQAVVWLRDTLGINVTERYLRRQTDAGELRCAVIAGARHYSSRALYEWLVTRPAHTKAKAVAS